MRGRSNVKASIAAERLLAELGITQLPICVFDIARQIGIEVVEKPDASGGVSGALVKLGNNFAIAYATHIDSDGFQRFSIAHELGHLHIDGHADALLPLDQKIHESKAGYSSNDPFEREADDFAANLLMPKDLFRAAMRNAGDGLPAIIALAELCETSRLATAIRYSNLTKDAMAIVVSDDQKICYSFLSDELRQFQNLNWPRRGTPVPDVPTATFNQDRQRVFDCEQEDHETPMSDWFGSSHSATLREQIIGLGQYGRTLTVLSSDMLVDEDQEDAELEESWTPRFRR